MQNEPYEVVAVVTPEQGPQTTLPKTVLVRIYEDQCIFELEAAVESFLEVEQPTGLYHTIPVGSAEDFVEYWIDYASDATDLADRLREALSRVYYGGGDYETATTRNPLP